jgi:type II restriction enzyme
MRSTRRRCRRSEIEASTSIYSGLLRLNDLVLSQPNNQIDLYIAVSESKKARVHDQLVRPSFQSLLSKCRFVAFEHVEAQAKLLESLGNAKDVRVSGLIEGEFFDSREPSGHLTKM